ncbi:hypothetical protein DPMN_155378 [Dreissena polymorpha]|uniref:Uncharacterized protein n=1 Tax=Dreissena polymorpha TaxID=45954 RepID=A0A9D4FNR2_DREPO|nr:hypothetical protein DPMN_155378 [Dreissena polymorpha]
MTPARELPRDPRSLTRAGSLTRVEKRSQSAKPYTNQGRECSQNRQSGLTIISNVTVYNPTSCAGVNDVRGGQGQPSNVIK